VVQSLAITVTELRSVAETRPRSTCANTDAVDLDVLIGVTGGGECRIGQHHMPSAARAAFRLQVPCARLVFPAADRSPMSPLASICYRADAVR
jgi:hypothetical protein